MKYRILWAVIFAVGCMWVFPADVPESQTADPQTEVKAEEAKASAETPPLPKGPRYKDENKNDVCDYREAGDPQGRMNRGGRQGQAMGPGQGRKWSADAGQQCRRGRGRGRCCGGGHGRGMGQAGMAPGKGRTAPERGHGLRLRKRDGSCLDQRETPQETPHETPPEKK